MAEEKVLEIKEKCPYCNNDKKYSRVIDTYTEYSNYVKVCACSCGKTYELVYKLNLAKVRWYE